MIEKESARTQKPTNQARSCTKQAGERYRVVMVKKKERDSAGQNNKIPNTHVLHVQTRKAVRLFNCSEVLFRYSSKERGKTPSATSELS